MGGAVAVEPGVPGAGAGGFARTVLADDAGKRLFDKTSGYYAYLKELSDQTIGINTEMVLGRVDALRAKLNVGTADPRAKFIGGLTPLNVGEELEYWPFEGEYWEDELGGYIYNIDAVCGKGPNRGSDKGDGGDKGGDGGDDGGGEGH